MISIIVPIFNGEASLRRCVDSVVGQSFGDWELVLVDDGSVDGCRDIAREYAAKDARIKVLELEHGGVVAARERGIAEARGEWLAFLDCDDWYESDFLLKMMAASADADIVWCDVVELGSEKHAIRYTPSDDIVMDLLTSNKHGWLWNKIYRKEYWDVVAPSCDPSCTVMEDCYMLLQLYAHKPKMAYTEEVLYNYDCTGSVSAVSKPFVMGRAYQNLRHIYSYLQQAGMLKKYNDQIERLLVRSKIDRLKMRTYVNEAPHAERRLSAIPMAFPANIIYWGALNSGLFRKLCFEPLVLKK